MQAVSGDPQDPFVFYTERRLVVLTGHRARTLAELYEYLQKVPGSSIFYHTHHRYLAHHFEKPLVRNDFAVWVGRALQHHALAEKLAAIDLLEFESIRQLREALLGLIENELAQEWVRSRRAPPGDEFHFCASQSFVIPTGVKANNVQELASALKQITNESLFYHVFVARLRLREARNDFSQWLRTLGEIRLAEKIEQVHPYPLTLDELRAKLIQLIEQHLEQKRAWSYGC